MSTGGFEQAEWSPCSSIPDGGLPVAFGVSNGSDDNAITFFDAASYPADSYSSIHDGHTKR